jgi:hypothetical protein
LRALVAGKVEFIVVGGISAVLQGASLMTFDLDIVHRRTEANIERLLKVLAGMKACYRLRRELSPEHSHLASEGHQLLATEFGPLDVLGRIGEGDYEDLIPHSVELDLAVDVRVRVLDIETYLREKERLKEPKDFAAAAVLRALLGELGRG